MRVLIVDDEAPARRRLARMLDEAASLELAQVKQARNANEAEGLLAAEDFDLVFLDINMPGMSGLEFAQRSELPKLVFVTAHDEHALAAFEVGAIDYSLKPLTAQRLERCLERVGESSAGGAGQLSELRATLARLSGQMAKSVPTRISARSGETTRVFALETISHFYAAEKYTAFRISGEEQLLDESLSDLEMRLIGFEFVRAKDVKVVCAIPIAIDHQAKLMGGQFS